MIRLGCDALAVERSIADLSGVEELFESEGLGTARACPSGTEAAHKGVAVLTELRTESVSPRSRGTDRRCGPCGTGRQVGLGPSGGGISISRERKCSWKRRSGAWRAGRASGS
jgi:hypothetical protein